MPKLLNNSIVENNVQKIAVKVEYILFLFFFKEYILHVAVELIRQAIRTWDYCYYFCLINTYAQVLNNI